VQVRLKARSLAERMFDDRHRGSHTRSGGHLHEPQDCPVSGSRELGQEFSIVKEIGSKNLRYGEDHLVVKHGSRDVGGHNNGALAQTGLLEVDWGDD